MFCLNIKTDSSTLLLIQYRIPEIARFETHIIKEIAVHTFIVDMWNGVGMPKTGSTTVSYFLSMNIFKSNISGSLIGNNERFLYETVDFFTLKKHSLLVRNSRVL